MKIRSKLQLNTAVMLALLALQAGIILTYLLKFNDELAELILLETVEETLFELEVNVSEHARAVLHYTGFPEQSTLNRIYDSQSDLERYLHKLETTKIKGTPYLFAKKVAGIDQEHSKIGNEIVSIVQQRNKQISIFRTMVRAIDDVVDEEFQAAISITDPDGAAKREAALDMEINIDEAFAAIEGYVQKLAPELKVLLADAETDFSHFVEHYRDTTITADETALLNMIVRSFDDALEKGNQVIVLTDSLNSHLKLFEQKLAQIDATLDEELQAFVHKEIENRSSKAEQLVRFAFILFAVFAMLIMIILTGVNFSISRGIVNGIEQLAEGLWQFGQGNLKFKIENKNKNKNKNKNEDELGQLAEKFNLMAEKIQKTTTSRDILIREVAARASVEKELESNQARFSGILKIAQEAIISINEVQEITIFNKGAETIFGYTEGEVLGKSIDMLIPEKYRKDHHKHVQRFSESDVDTRMMGREMELFGLRKNGTLFPGEATISKLLSNGTQTLTVILRDITQRKQIEERLKDHTLLLEQAVEEKTREMQELSGRMVRHEKLATIGKIAGNIAHELRNPLGVVNQTVFYLNRIIGRGQVERFSDKISSSLSLIEAELNTANTVISNLLAATRARELTMVLTDLEELVLNVISNGAVEQELDINFQLEPTPFFITVDPEQFQQVIYNLLVNAMQTNVSDLQVTISASILAEGNRARILIEDNGTGISANHIDNVFEPLYTTRDMGTGLGLSICQQIVESHSGSITINNSTDQGTAVEIILPLDGLSECGLNKESLG